MELVVKDVHVTLGKAKIVNGVSLHVGERQSVGIIGPNGCGKSTLFMNLSGLLRPQQGAVLWQGKPLDYSKRGLLALRQPHMARHTRVPSFFGPRKSFAARVRALYVRIHTFYLKFLQGHT